MAELPTVQPTFKTTSASIAPAIQGVQAATQGQMLLQQSLGDKLSSFFGVTEQIVTPYIQQKAQADAQAATEYDRKSRWTIYGQAYNKAADTKYAIDTNFDSRVSAATLGNKFKDSPKTFLDTYMKSAKVAIDSAPTPVLKDVVTRSYQQNGMKEYERILRLNATKIAKQNADSYAGFLKVKEQDYYSAIANGDENSANDAAMQINQLVNSAINNNMITEGEGAAVLDGLIIGGYRQNVMRGFHEASTNNQQMKYIEDFYTKKHPLLTEQQITETGQAMLAEMKNRNAFYDEQVRSEQVKLETEQKFNYDMTKQGLLSGSVTEVQLKSMYENNELSKSQYDELAAYKSNTGPAYDNQETLFNTNRYLTEMTDEQIANLDNLTYATRTKLMADRKDQLTTKFKWTASENGREALRRVKMHFGIMEGTIMAQVDFTNQNMKDLDKMHQQLFDEVMSLPPDQRESKALGIATSLINQYESSKQKQQDDERKANEQAAKDAAQKRADVYNSGTFHKLMHQWGFSDNQSWQDVIDPRYNYLKESKQ